MKTIFKRLKALSCVLFGQFSWQKPVWLGKIIQPAQQRPFKFWGITLSTAIILSGGCYAVGWYQHLPQPTLAVAEITPPEILEASNDPKPPSALYVKFARNNLAQSVAPLDKINKPILNGIHLMPAVTGTWRWQSDHELNFIPENPWPAGQKYTLSLDPTLFASHVKLQKYTYLWNTAAFTAGVNGLTLYQNPKNPAEQQIVATIDFNYPINPQQITKYIHLILEKTKQIPLTATFGKLNREVYVHSANIQLGAQPQYVSLMIDGDVKPQLGQTQLNAQVQDKLLLPDADSMLKITRTDSMIVRNPEGVPEQVLTLDSTIGVQTQDLMQYLHAYVLPKKKNDAAWNSPGEVTADQLALAQPLPLQMIQEDHPYPTHHNFRYNALPGRTIYVVVDADLPGYGGYHLKNKFHDLIETPEYPQEIRFLHKGALLSLGSEHKLSILVRGVPAVKFEISRVLPNEINHLITQTEGRFSDPYFSNNYFDKNDLSELFTEIKRFNTEDKAKIQYTALDLDRYLAPNKKNTRPLGLFLLTAKGWDAQHHTETGKSASRLILMTDMGLIIKNNADQSRDVFVQSISQGKAVADAQIDILGKNGLPLTTGKTDAQGHVLLPDVSQFKEAEEPTVYMAHKGNDVSFMPYHERDREINLSRFDVAGITDENQHDLSADLFSDRGIYRPGDLIHFGMIVKQAYAYSAGVNIPVEATLTDPRGITVLDKKMKVDDVGLLTLDYQTQENSLTGNYTLSLDILNKDKRQDNLGTTEVQVMEFLPDTMKISSHLTTENTLGWVSPDKLGATILLKNLFGTPAMNRKVSGKIVLSPHEIYFNQFPDYLFYDPLYDPKNPPKQISEDLPDQQTDAQGQAKFDFDLGHFDKATYWLNFYVQGYEANGGRSVSAENSVLVSPSSYLLGYKTDGKMNFIKQNSSRSLHLIAVNNQLQKIAVPHLNLQLLKENPIATLVQKANGTYQYETTVEEIPIHKMTLNLPADGYDYVLPTQQVGDYQLTISDADGMVLNRTSFSVVGNHVSNLQKNTELTVKLDKSEYHPGEAIHLQITAPYAGSGLITIERDKVYSYQWFTTTSDNTEQTINIPNNLVGNGYVNVTFIRDWNSPEISLSPLSARVIPFKINPGNHEIKLNWQIPEEIKPGQIIPIRYRTSQPGKIVIFAVDEGILQAGNYTLPDPLGYFFQKRALQVSTTQTVDQILPKFILNRELSAVGGDENAKIRPNYLNPFKRKTEKPVVFWSGIVSADQQWRTMNYTVPDYFNGSLRIMAVAVADDAVGAAAQSSLVRGDFILTPMTPTSVSPDDQFDVSVNVSNHLKNLAADPIGVGLQTSAGLAVVGNNIQKLLIDANQEQTAHFTVKATDHLGNTTLTFTAADPDHHAQIQSTLSVRPAAPYQVSFISGQSDSKNNTLILSRKLYPDFAKRTVIAASGPVIFLQGLQNYLESYPYACTEQVSSKGFGYLAFSRSQNIEATATQLNLNQIIQTLRQRQTSEGGFLYWPGMASDHYDSRFASVYALHFLTEARSQGYLVPGELIRSGLQYLDEIVSQSPNNLEDARLQAYAIYILARNEIVPTNYLSHLQQYLEEKNADNWRKDIAGALIAASYQILQDNKTADSLIQNYQLKSDNLDGIFNSYVRNSLYIYLLAKHFPERFKALGDQVLLDMASEVANNELNTLSSAYTLSALSSYYSNFSSDKNSLTIQEIFSDKQYQALPAQKNTLTPVEFDSGAEKLLFENPQRSNYFYQIYLAGYDRELPLQPITQGIEISREYTQDDAVITQTVKQGTDITVHVKIRSINDQYYDHIAVVDLLPGGFELIPHSISGSYDYVDAREDRIIFYTSAGNRVCELTYHVKPITKGHFIVPPPFAENMYNQRVMARGKAAPITIQ